MSAAALQQALSAVGLPCAVEARERLAVLAADVPVAAALRATVTRELAVRLAAEHGFTHVALELRPAATHALLALQRAALPRA